MSISKNYLLPRPGLPGLLDRIAGPKATTAELLIQFIPPAIFAMVAPIYAQNLPLDWTLGQLGLISLLGFDLIGGILTNATSSAKRWFHRREQTWQNHLVFVSIHLVHIFLVALLFRNSDWSFFWIVSSYLIGSSILILRIPLYLQRSLALGLYSLALLGNLYLFDPTPGLDWFLPLFFLKLLVSHLLNETPYQPNEIR
ncbi:hypothetical protein [Calothrix rhizosoleniae]|uniref:hypothetical protein n=1 Tax=Calothrix rhizosoleniae TaxID=888997 RepID=UPI000B4A3090|nr:hypothetical protein [Calothrix rhizosoleniae]